MLPPLEPKQPANAPHSPGAGHRVSLLSSISQLGTIPGGFKPVWHHWPLAEPSWLFLVPCSSSMPLGMTSRSVCANTFRGTDHPGGSPMAPPCLSGKGLWQLLRLPQVSPDQQALLESMASHWHSTAPTSPAMLHSWLVNTLIDTVKGPLPAPTGVQLLLCLAASLLSLSSAMVRRMPFPRGREIHGLLPLPITKMLESLVAKLLPLASFT